MAVDLQQMQADAVAAVAALTTFEAHFTGDRNYYYTQLKQITDAKAAVVKVAEETRQPGRSDK